MQIIEETFDPAFQVIIFLLPFPSVCLFPLSALLLFCFFPLPLMLLHLRHSQFFPSSVWSAFFFFFFYIKSHAGPPPELTALLRWPLILHRCNATTLQTAVSQSWLEVSPLVKLVEQRDVLCWCLAVRVWGRPPTGKASPPIVLSFSLGSGKTGLGLNGGTVNSPAHHPPLFFPVGLLSTPPPLFTPSFDHAKPLSL